MQSLLRHSTPEITAVNNIIWRTAWRRLTCEAGLAGLRFRMWLDRAGFRQRLQATSQKRADAPQVLKNLVDVAGIEPATPCLQSRCSPS